MPHKQTAHSIIDAERKYRREHGHDVPRYAVGNDGSAVGAWDESENRWVQIAGRLINGQWADLPYELLVDGKLPQITWSEYPAA